MIVILEGCNGVGKSTYARAIAERTNGRIVRPFRPSDPNYHFTGNTPLEQHLKGLLIPFNTYVDDMYVADMLFQLEGAIAGPVILDRSMPSAIAYCKSSDWPAKLSYWQSKMVNMDAHYVWLRSRYDSVPGTERRLSFDRYNELHSTFRHVYEIIGFHKMYLETPGCQPSDGVDKVLRWLGLKT